MGRLRRCALALLWTGMVLAGACVRAPEPAADRPAGDDAPAADLARVGVHQFRVEPSLPAGDVLDDHPEGFVSVDHDATPIAARTAASMLSSIR